MSRGVRSARPWRARHLVLAASTLVTLLAGAWSVVLPLGEGPDEPAHLGLVLHLADGRSYPDHDGLQRTVGVERLCTTFAASVRVCPRSGEEVSATAIRVRGREGAPHRTTRPSWTDDDGRRATAELNQMPQHPPLYYASMAVVLRGARTAIGGPMSLDRELALLRLANVFLVAPVPALAWITARKVGVGRRTAAAASLLGAGVPMLAATGGAVNNDNLLVLLGAAAAPLIAGLAVGDRSRRTVLATGIVIGAALLTKAFAVVLLPTVALACWVGSRADRAGSVDGASPVTGAGEGPVDGAALMGPRVRRALEPLMGVSLVVLVVAGWWYVGTWIRSGSPTPSADADRYTEALRPPGFSPDLVDFAGEFTGRFTERFWGSFGWYSARLPGTVTVVLTIVAVALAVVGLRVARRRAVVLVLVGPAALLLVLTAARAWSLHARSGQYPFIQGRYVLGGVIGLAVVAAVGWTRLVRGRWSLPALALVVVGVQVGALVRGLTTYWTGGALGRLEALDAWSGWPDGVALALVVGAFLAAVGLLVVAVTTAAPATERDGDGERAPVPSATP